LRALGLGVGLADQGQLHHLLGDRRAALDRGLARLVGDQRPQGALEVEGAVLVEAGVLDGDDRLDHGPGDLRQRDVDAVLVVDRRDHVAVGVDDPGLLRKGFGLELGRQVVHAAGDVPGREPDHPREGDRQTGHHNAEHGGHRGHDTEVGEHAVGREALVGRHGHEA
jgi:hypothetical protein